MGKPTLVQRMWLWKRSYVRVGGELDSAARAGLATESEEDGLNPGAYRLQYRRMDGPHIDR